MTPEEELKARGRFSRTTLLHGLPEGRRPSGFLGESPRWSDP